ncbi:MAG: CPBP family intramembrane metalloprotease [Anaerolineales bacterium]|nr:CPBP family intramembrane metalloprotease [Anaerolineales bacterium]
MDILKQRPTWLFFTLTFLVSWSFWIPAALLGQEAMTFPTILLYFLGGCGPSLVGILFLYLDPDRDTRRDFWRRVIDFRRIQGDWYGSIILIFPAVAALSIALNQLLGGPLPPLPVFLQLLDQPALLIPLFISTLIGGPLSEELGWRGFALDRLQVRWKPLVASLILGLFWWAWHLPLFFIQGSPQSVWGFGTAMFWLFLIGVFPLSVLITWAYNQNRRSILSAILIHFFYNLTISVVYPLPPQVEVLRVVLSILVVALVIRLSRPKPTQELEIQAQDQGG